MLIILALGLYSLIQLSIAGQYCSWPMHSYCRQRWSVRILVATGRGSYYVKLVPTRRYPTEGVSEVGVTSFIDFWQLKICCWRSEEKWEQLFFGNKIPHLESVFGNWDAFQCCGPLLEYCVRLWCKLIRKWPRNTAISVTR